MLTVRAQSVNLPPALFTGQVQKNDCRKTLLPRVKDIETVSIFFKSSFTLLPGCGCVIHADAVVSLPACITGICSVVLLFSIVAAAKPGRKMMISEQNDEECDATKVQ